MNRNLDLVDLVVAIMFFALGLIVGGAWSP
jgi:hypothetical protein